MRPRRVLIAGAPASLASLYRSHLEAAGHACAIAASLAAAERALAAEAHDAVLLDLDLIGDDAAVGRLKACAPNAVIVVVAANASIAAAVTAVRSGAWDYMVKPVARDRLVTTLANACERARFAAPAARTAPAGPADALATMVGTSGPMQALSATLRAVAASRAPVFVTGESGTGKELCAQAIHALGPRARRPFVAINCGAIPRDLMESEIFGHLKGSFTGAIADRDGAARAADGGTLFLDEICELDLALQTKLLRFLQTGTIQRVGASQVETVDVRILCATNRSPRDEVAAGRFREDLYFRLHVVPVQVPALRERGHDVVLLARRFLAEYAAEEGKRFAALAAEAELLLAAQPWPGNVRELQNAIRQAVVLNDGEVMTAAMLAAALGQAAPAAPAASATGLRPLWQVERDTIEAAVAAFDGSIPRAAQALGISPSTIYRKREAWGPAAP